MYKLYSVGRRCNSVEFLKKYNLYSGASPIDWDVCDLGTVIYFLNNKFNGYTDDLYLPWSHKLINKKNITDPLVKGDAKYLNIRVKNHKGLAINLNVTELNNCYDMYRDNGLYFFHYDMNNQINIQTKQRRIERFLNEDISKIYLFHIYNIVEYQKFYNTFSNIKELVKQVNYKFIIVIPVSDWIENSNNLDSDSNSDVKDDVKEIIDNNIYIILKVPSLEKQLNDSYIKNDGKIVKPIGNENNISDIRINWDKVNEVILKYIN